MLVLTGRITARQVSVATILCGWSSSAHSGFQGTPFVLNALFRLLRPATTLALDRDVTTRIS